VRIKERSGYGGEERSLANTARIMTHVGDFDRFVTGEFGLGLGRKLFDSYGFIHYRNSTLLAADLRG
jgi:hypothetical protein